MGITNTAGYYIGCDLCEAGATGAIDETTAQNNAIAASYVEITVTLSNGNAVTKWICPSCKSLIDALPAQG